MFGRVMALARSVFDAFSTKATEEASSSSILLRFVRFGSLVFALILALLLIPSISPNVLSASSKRAVVNARVTLVTSPISGRILQVPLSSGERFKAGDVVARIENATIDRSALMELRLQSLAATERSSILSTDIRQQQQRIEELDSQISQLTSQVMLQLGESEGEARAKFAAASASAGAKRTLATRMLPLLKSNIITRKHIDLLEQEADAAAADMTAAEHALRSKAAALEAAHRGVFIGEAFGLLIGLQQQRIAAEAAIKKYSAELVAVQQRETELKRLSISEDARLSSLSEAVIVAPADSYVLDIEQMQGQFVDAGTKILRTTSCSTAVVTAIFPLTMVGELSLGAPVHVELQSDEGVRRATGHVTRILPRDTDRASEKLWVPLPPAQANEVHVLVAIDKNFSGTDDANCNIGSWVRASVESPLHRAFNTVTRQIVASFRRSLDFFASIAPRNSLAGRASPAASGQQERRASYKPGSKYVYQPARDA